MRNYIVKWTAAAVAAVVFGGASPVDAAEDAGSRPSADATDVAQAPETGADVATTCASSTVTGGLAGRSGITVSLGRAEATGGREDRADDIAWRNELNQAPEDDRQSTSTELKGTDRGGSDVSNPASGLGSMLLQMLVALGAVCLIAWAILKWGVSRLVGGTGDDDGPIEVVARKPVGPESAVLIVRVGPRILILGDGEDGMSRLGELDDDEFDQFEAGRGDEANGQTSDRPLTSLWRFGRDSGDEELED